MLFPPRQIDPAPFLPMSRQEMELLGWSECDIVLVTGDAYIDHPSFGMAIIGRVLEAAGFRIGIISQPDWQSAEPFRALGRPRLFFGVTSGNMDSMVNRYTSDKRIRSNDAYTPNDEGGKRPDRSVIVYAQRCREAFADCVVVIGGIEASLRRIAHFDYWSETVRRSILPDAKADLLVYGNAERQVIEIARRLDRGEPVAQLTDIRGTAVMRKAIPEGWQQIDASNPDVEPVHPPRRDWEHTVLRLPSYEQVANDKLAYAHASRLMHLETNPFNARALIQRHGEREVWLNPPPLPLTTPEMDAVYDLPFARAPHPGYGGARIPAWEMIRFSVNIMRGCFGGCTFCSITEHEGRIIQNRSEGSILREVEAIRDRTPGFTGVVSDLGGPTANMYRLACKDRKIEAACRKPSCVYPDICENLGTDHNPLIRLYRKVRALPGIKKVLIGSGVRYDLAVTSPEYVQELAQHHVGGYLKIAPEHTESGPLAKMMKPGIGIYYAFKKLFDRYSKAAGKEQYLIPYFIAAHPGTRDEDMLNLAIWLKKNGFRPDQVQAFLPSPMSAAAALYHTGLNTLRKVSRASDAVYVPRGLKQRRLHKAFLRYHDPENWPLLRQTLKQMGRTDLIGNGPECLIPVFGGGTGGGFAGGRPSAAGKGAPPARRPPPGAQPRNETRTGAGRKQDRHESRGGQPQRSGKAPKPVRGRRK